MFKILGALILWYLLLCLVVVLLTTDLNQLQMRMWKVLTEACHKVAHFVGSVAIYTEIRYNKCRSVV